MMLPYLLNSEHREEVSHKRFVDILSNIQNITSPGTLDFKSQ